MTAPELYQSLDRIEKAKLVNLPKYKYPKNVLMVNDLQKLCRANVSFKIHNSESTVISRLDSQKPYKKSLFGNGLLVCNEKAEELPTINEVVDDKTICWELSDRELEIVNSLSSNDIKQG